MDEDNFYNALEKVIPGSSQDNQDLFFERISKKHLEGMHLYSTDERMYEYLEFDAFQKVNQTLAYIKKLENRIGSKVFGRTAIYWAVIRRSDKRVIGTMGLSNINFSRQNAEWGFGVDPKLKNSGYIFQMLEILKSYVFETLKLHRIFSTTMYNNLPTIAVLEGAGLTLEGRLRDYYQKSGAYIDAVIYSMLKAEYYLLKETPIESKNTEKPNEDIVNKVTQIVGDILNSDGVNHNSSMSNEPKWDSLNHVTIMVAVSKFYHINISPLDIGESISVKSIISLVKKKF